MEDSIKQLIKEGDEIIVQVEKEKRVIKALCLIQLYFTGGQIFGLDAKQPPPKQVASAVKSQVKSRRNETNHRRAKPTKKYERDCSHSRDQGADDLQNDLDHLLDIWKSIQEQNKKTPKPLLGTSRSGRGNSCGP